MICPKHIQDIIGKNKFRLIRFDWDFRRKLKIYIKYLDIITVKILIIVMTTEYGKKEIIFNAISKCSKQYTSKILTLKILRQKHHKCYKNEHHYTLTSISILMYRRYVIL